MPEYIDCYCLVKSRSQEIVERFLERFIPNRQESADDYMSNGTVFTDAEDLLKHLQENIKESNSVYWRTTDEESEVQHAMAFYTDDGSMILGLSFIGNNRYDERAKKILNSMCSFLSSEIACLTVEEPPPTNSLEFIDFCKKRFV